MEEMIFSINEKQVVNKIYHLREQSIMIDEDLAELYGIEVKRLNKQVKRNNDRFPEDFMFQLSKEEYYNLKSQFATSSWGGRRTMPYAFTEHDVLMLSSVLSSKIAIAVNIQIMRVYVKLRKLISSHQSILDKLDEVETAQIENTKDIQVIFNVLNKLLTELKTNERKPIGFKTKK